LYPWQRNVSCDNETIVLTIIFDRLSLSVAERGATTAIISKRNVQDYCAWVVHGAVLKLSLKQVWYVT